MGDLVSIAIVIGSCFATYGLIVLCDRLLPRERGGTP
jgi:hypothetical protein